MSDYTDITSSYIWAILWRSQALSYHVVCVLHNMFRGKSLLEHQQWNYRHSHLIITSVISLFFQVLYNFPIPSRQEQGTANLYPFPTLRNCLQYRIWWKSCSTAPTFAVLCVKEWRTRFWLVFCVQSELWRVQHHTTNCSCDLTFWTVYFY